MKDLRAFLFSLLLSAMSVTAQNAGPNNAATFESQNITGSGATIAWNNTGNLAAFDNTFATCGPITNISHNLVASGFNFALPANAVIVGIEVSWYRLSNDASHTRDNTVRILKNGTLGSTNKAQNAVWTADPAWSTYGGSSDLWGETWTPADINAAGFGVAFSVRQSSGTPIVSVDNIRITIYATVPLPVKLTAFSAVEKNGKISVTWTTESEKNNDFFTLEKSQNGSTFTQVAEVKGNGTTNKKTEYEFTDEEPVEGNSYYRLRQTDFNGENENIGLITVHFEKQPGKGCVLKVFPNPCYDECTVKLDECEGNSESEIEVELIDAAGQKVYSKVPYRDDKGNFQFSIDPENNLKPGVYIVRGVAKKEHYSLKMVRK